jgi:hypothetical protein
MATTYTPIATTTANGTSLSVTFSSISSTYTDLILVCSLTSGNTGDAYLRFNGDTGTNYSDTVVRGNGTTASSVRNTSAAGIDVGAISAISGSNIGTLIINVMNYSNSTTNKTSLIRFSAGSAWVNAIVGLWRSTTAISEITMASRGGNWGNGSTFTLYGVKSA